MQDKAPEHYEYPLLIKQLLHHPLAVAPNREIVYADKNRYTYTEFNTRLQRLANALTDAGVKHGQTVAVMDWDSHRYLECFFAVPMMGAVLHTVNVRLSPEQILYTINHAEDAFILLNAEFVPLLEPIANRIEQPCKFILINDLLNDSDDTIQGNLKFAGEYETMLQAASASFDFHDFDENTRATTFYTTGTTGKPKGVFYSHRQIVLHTLAATAGLAMPKVQGRLHREDVYFPLTPMFHVHAWGLPYIATMMGLKQVYPGRYEPEKILRLMAKEGATFSHCVPTILYMLLSCPVIDEIDLTNWKVIIGGSALPRGMAKAALARGVDIYSGYGMSETGPILTLAQLDSDKLGDDETETDLRCKTGRPLPMVDLRVVDADMKDANETGEVVARSPWLTQAYLKNPASSEALWAGGYLHTGDIGHIDDNGYLQVTDRIKDIIKSGGEWISSLELEDIVSRCEGVAEVAAIGLPDPKWGETPTLLIVKKEPTSNDINEQSIKAQIQTSINSGTISKWAMPNSIQFVDKIEKTSVGKINKKALREKYS